MTLVRAKIIYSDDKELLVDIEEKNLEDFSKNISNQQVYWNDKQTQGFWTDISKIRYINFIRENENISNELTIDQVQPTSGQTPSEDEGSNDIEDASHTG